MLTSNEIAGAAAPISCRRYDSAARAGDSSDASRLLLHRQMRLAGGFGDLVYIAQRLARQLSGQRIVVAQQLHEKVDPIQFLRLKPDHVALSRWFHRQKPPVNLFGSPAQSLREFYLPLLQ